MVRKRVEPESKEQNQDRFEWQDWVLTDLCDDQHELDDVSRVFDPLQIRSLGAAWEWVVSAPDRESDEVAMVRNLFDRFLERNPQFDIFDDPRYHADPKVVDDVVEDRTVLTQDEIDRLERNSKSLGRIRRADQKARTLEARYLELKGEATAAKKAWELSIVKLQKTIADSRSGQLSLLDDDDDQDVQPESDPAVTAATTAESGPAPDESWRPVPLGELEIPVTLLEKWAELDPPIRTVGDMANWTSTYDVTDLPGVGPAMAEKVRDALEAFWSGRQVEPDQEDHDQEHELDESESELEEVS